MALAVWQSSIVNDQGTVQPLASVEVRRESTGALVSIYSDRAGTTPLSNPVTADSTGFAQFFVAGGAYRITATKGSFTKTWRYVAIGTNAESDFAAALLAQGAWAGAASPPVVYTAGDIVSYAAGSPLSDNYAFVLNEGGDGSVAPTIDGNGVGQSDENWTVIGIASPSNAVLSDTVRNVVSLTQAAYDALDPPDTETFYIIISE